MNRAPSAKFKPEEFFAPYPWFQKWEVFDGIFTPGTHNIETLFREFKIPANLSGKRVLDVGARNGAISFECERRGAKEVVALGPEDPQRTGFSALQTLLRSRKTRYQVGSAYSLDPTHLGHFDMVFFSGVLVHLRYPLLAIDNLRRVARDEVFVNTVLQKAGRKGQQESLALYLDAVPSWRFLRRRELKHDFSNWFIPNKMAVIQAFESAGFDITYLKKGRFHARVQKGLPEFLDNPSCESLYYPELMGPLLHPYSPWSVAHKAWEALGAPQWGKLPARIRQKWTATLKRDAFEIE